MPHDKKGNVIWQIIKRLTMMQFFGCMVILIGSLVPWFYIISSEFEMKGRLLVVEGIIYGGVLLVALYQLFIKGYDRNSGVFFRVSFVFSVVLSIIGFYLIKLPLIRYPDSERGYYFYHMLKFLFYAGTAASLSVIPLSIISLVRSAIIWISDLLLGR